ncbi:MAG: ferrous iron transport protein A [Oscillospiraceae bacterium]|nr:ferrous iron transport protein A [Oscillospiraceae bacterium]
MGISSANLYEMKSEGILQVTSVPDISLLDNLGLRAGTQVMILIRYKLGGPVLLRVEGAYSVALGKDIAQQISVQEVSPA